MGTCLGRCEGLVVPRECRNLKEELGSTLKCRQYKKVASSQTPDVITMMVNNKSPTTSGQHTPATARKSSTNRPTISYTPIAATDVSSTCPTSAHDDSRDEESSDGPDASGDNDTAELPVAASGSFCDVCCSSTTDSNVMVKLSCSHAMCCSCVIRTSKSTRQPGLLTDVKGAEQGTVTFCPFCRKATYLSQGLDLKSVFQNKESRKPSDKKETNCCAVNDISYTSNNMHMNSAGKQKSEKDSSNCHNEPSSQDNQSNFPSDGRSHTRAVSTTSDLLLSKKQINKSLSTAGGVSDSCVGCRVMVADVQLDCQHFVCRLCSYTGLVRLCHQKGLSEQCLTSTVNTLNNSFCPRCNDVKVIRFEYDVIPKNSCTDNKNLSLAPNTFQVTNRATRRTSVINSRCKLIYPDLSMKLPTPQPPQRLISTHRRTPLQCSLTHRSHSCPVHTGGHTLNDITLHDYVHSASFHHITERSSVDHHPKIMPPVPPKRRVYKTSTSSQSLNSQLVCVKRFGRYSSVKMQTGAFEHPTKVSVSAEGTIAVVDHQQMVVQIFSATTDYLSMFKVMGIRDVCFLSYDRVAIATHRGVYIYTTSGHCIQRLLSSHGPITSTSSCNLGFCATTLQSLTVFTDNYVEQKVITHRRKTTYTFWNLLKRTQSVELGGIRDAAINANKDYVLLDNVSGVVYIVDGTGFTKLTIIPEQHACGRLRNPQAIAVDRHDNIIIADTGNQRIVQFNNNGVFTKCLLSFTAPLPRRHSVLRRPKPHVQLYPHGVCTTDLGLLIVSLSGCELAQIRIYQNVENV